MVDIFEVVAERTISSYHYRNPALCAAAMFMDGFDTQIVGYVAPVLGKVLSIPTGGLHSCQFGVSPGNPSVKLSSPANWSADRGDYSRRGMSAL